MNMKKLFLSVCSMMIASSIFAQVKIFSEKQFGGESVEIGLGSSEVSVDFRLPQSVQIESGQVAIFYERFFNGTPSGRHKLVDKTEANVLIPFKPVYAIVFENPKNTVVAFEKINFGGKIMFLTKSARNKIPESFGVSSLYIPQGLSVRLYKDDPSKESKVQVEYRDMNSGIKPFVGGDMAQQIKFIDVK